MSSLPSPDKKLSRRDFIKFTAQAAAATVLVACAPPKEDDFKIAQKKMAQTATAQFPKTEVQILTENNAPPEIIDRTTMISLDITTEENNFFAGASGYVLETRIINGKNIALIATAGHLFACKEYTPNQITAVRLIRPQINNTLLSNEPSLPLEINFVNENNQDYGFMLVELKPEFVFSPIQVITKTNFSPEKLFALGYPTAGENPNITIEQIPFIVTPDQISNYNEDQMMLIQSSSPGASGTVLVNQNGQPVAIQTEIYDETSRTICNYFPPDFENIKQSMYDNLEL